MASAALPARARARIGVLGGIAAVVFVLSLLGTVIVDAAAGAAVTGVRSAVAAAEGSDGAMRWQIRRSSDVEAQTAAGATVLDRALPAGTSWARSVESAPIAALVDGEPSDAELVLLDDAGAGARATLVAGAWPEDPVAIDAAAEASALPATVHREAAAALDLAPGSVLDLEGGRRLLVVGVWEPADARDPAWFGEPIVATGLADGAAGPLLVDEAALEDLPVAVRVRWTALADAAALDPGSAAALTGALDDVATRLTAEPGIGQDGVMTLGGLRTTLIAVLTGLDAVRAIAPTPLLLLAAAGIAALSRLATLLSSARRGETVLLRARGAATGQLTRWQAVESLAVAVPPALLGCALGEAALTLAKPGEARSWAIAAAVGAVVVLGATLVTTVGAWREARRPVTRGAADDSGRLARAAALGGTVLIALAAAISFWQFRLYGSPLVRAAGGGTAIDPVAVLAPVLVVLALCLGALALTPAAARLLERSAARRPGLVPALPMRQLARRTPLFSAVAFTTMLGIAGLALSAGIAGSWRSFDTTAAAVATGGEIRVVGANDLDTAAMAIEAMPRVEAVSPVLRREARIGSETATLIATPLGALTSVAPGLPADVAPALELLAAPSAPQALPIAIDAALAETLGVGEDSSVSLRFAANDARIDARVVAVLGAVPGAAAGAVLADLDRLGETIVANDGRPVDPDELWLEASDPVAVATAIDRERPGGAVALTRAAVSSEALVTPAITSLWLGAAGALVLAIATLLALVAALGEARSGEVLVLRALGTPAATQARARFFELAAVVAIAMVLGGAIGLIAGVMTASELGRAAVPAAPAALHGGVAIDGLPLALALIGFALVAAGIAGGAAHGVRRRAARPGREEVR